MKGPDNGPISRERQVEAWAEPESMPGNGLTLFSSADPVRDDSWTSLGQSIAVPCAARSVAVGWRICCASSVPLRKDVANSPCPGEAKVSHFVVLFFCFSVSTETTLLRGRLAISTLCTPLSWTAVVAGRVEISVLFPQINTFYNNKSADEKAWESRYHVLLENNYFYY